MSQVDGTSAQIQSPKPGETMGPKPKRPRGVVYRSLSSMGGKSLRFAGKVGIFASVVAAANLAWYYIEQQQVDWYFSTLSDEKDEKDEKSGKQKQSKRKKQVLVLPMHSLKLVEHRTSNDIDLERLTTRDKIPRVVMEVRELVDIIHKAAADPNIVALHADFDEGMRYPMGYAHIEEIRNAIRIFNESHRVHRDPNVGHNPVFAMPRNGDPKPSYAFGHSFQWNEYFLASAFSYVHLQARGNLHLFGATTMNTFFGPALDKYGIKAHVFKHGDYKTAPNLVTEKGYTKAHLETVKSMTSSLNNTICTCIETSRALKFDDVMWQSVFDYGSLTATNSQEIALVDSTPSVDPLMFLLDANESEEAKKKMEGKLGLNIGYSKFSAKKSVTLSSYKNMLDKKERVENKQSRINAMVRDISERSTATNMILSGLGFKPDKASPKRDKVAVVMIDGTITNGLSYKIVSALRQIRKDKSVQCVVLRVNSPGGSVTSSESILEEIKALEKPVICSMSNLAASGGYYISANCEKIYAQPTTLTGSIGVYGVKFDASKWAKSYGIHGDHYPRKSHGAAFNPLTPLTPGMKENLARLTLGNYDYFKSIVAAGRSISVDKVEEIAGGRVWTGEQAKEVKLVDALGGLHCAISYAKSAHTKTDQVDIEYWPRKTSVFESLPRLLSMQGSVSDIFRALIAAAVGLDINTKGTVDNILMGLADLKFAEKPHFMATMDEETAISLAIQANQRA